MTRIRRVNSYRNPYLPISKLSHMNAYGTDPVDAVNRVDPVPPINNELTQVNKYMDIKDKVESDKVEKNSMQLYGKTQSVTELSGIQGTMPPKKKFESVTINLERYEQMRQDVERLKQLEDDLSRMIQYFPAPTAVKDAEGFRIRVDKGEIKKYMTQLIIRDHENTKGIDITDIDLK